MPEFMNTLTRVIRGLACVIAALALSNCARAPGSSGIDLGYTDLKCEGRVVLHYMSGLPSVIPSQVVAVRVNKQKLAFSGNSFLGDESIKICGETEAGELNFDSETCVGTRRTARDRRYGTLNKITGKLEFSNTRWPESLEGRSPDSTVWLNDGVFTCAKVTPVVP
jgi:hypothetical protein